MDDLSKKLDSLFRSPDSMAKIQSVLSALGGDNPSTPSSDGQKPEPADSAVPPDPLSSVPAETEKRPPSAEELPPEEPVKEKGLDPETLMALLPLLGGGKPEGGKGGLPDLGMLTKLLPLFTSLQQDNENTRLLHALRPHLHGDREQKLDGAIKMMQLAQLLPLLGKLGDS